MPKDSCPIRWLKYIAWIKSAPDVQELHKVDYATHLMTCPACRQTLDADAAGPALPPFDEVMSEAVK